VKNLTLKLAGKGPIERNRSLLEISGSEQVRVNATQMVGSAGPGLSIDASRQVVADGCEVSDSSTYGTYIGASRQVLVSNSDTTGSVRSGVDVSSIGSIYWSCDYVRILNNRISEVDSGFGVGRLD